MEVPSRPEKRPWSLSEATRIQSDVYAAFATSENPTVRTLVDWSSRLTSAELLAKMPEKPRVASAQAFIERLDTEALSGEWWHALVPGRLYQNEQGHYYFILERPLQSAERYNDRREEAREQAEAFLRDQVAGAQEARVHIVSSRHLPGSQQVFYLVRASLQKEPI